MLPLEQPDRIQIAFDDHRLVANAGLLLPVTLAQRLGLSQLVDRHVDLGRAPGRANTGDQMLTLVASALAGGDCIDDADVLRAGGVGRVLGCVVKAPSTLGTFRRSFRWGHVRQLDRVSRELLAQAWATDAGPGDGPLTIDLDSTVCETFGLCKEGAQRHNYAGQRGYHPILAVAAGTGDVLMARLRQGRANTARGAADAAETTYVPFESKPNAATVRLIVRRVKPTPGTQLALFANYSYHAFITDREGDTLELEADHRRHAEIENAIRDLKYGVGLNHLPSGRFPANPEPAEGGLAGRPGDGPQLGPLDNARRSGRATGDHQDPAATLLRSARTAHPLGAPSHPASDPGLALAEPVQQRSGETARPATPFLTVAPVTGPPPPQSSASHSKVSPTRAARLGQRGLPAAFGRSIRGSLRRQQAHYRRHPSEIRRDEPLSIPVVFPSRAHTTPFGGSGLRL